MSNFLIDLARRGAGLPVTAIQPPPPSPFGSELHTAESEATELQMGPSVAPSVGPSTVVRELRASPQESIAAQRVPPPTAQVEPATVGPAVRATSPPPAIQRFSAKNTESSGPVVLAPSAGPRQPVAAIAPITTPISAALEPDLSVAHIEAPALGGVNASGPSGDADVPEVAQVRQLSRRIIAKGVRKPAIESETLSSPTEHGSVPGERRVRQVVSAQDERLSVVPTIRPVVVESVSSLQFPSPPAPVRSLPIHVRIGRIEVRGAPPQATQPVAPAAPAPLGFAGYARIRSYRNWPL